MAKRSSEEKGIALYGGSFDPVHKGHIAVMRCLAARFEQVIVLPAFLSPFKRGAEAAPASDRLQMALLAAKGMDNVTVSAYELDKGGTSYSYLTARHYQAAGGKLTLVIGSDMLPSLDRWKNVQELKRTVDFLVVERTGYPAPEACITALKQSGARIRLADFSAPDVSSSGVRVALAFRKAEAFLTPDILSYIYTHHLYKTYAYIVDRYGVFGMKEERIAHTYRAVLAGIWLAKRHDCDTEQVITALLLHDIGKYCTKAQLEEQYGISGIHLDPLLPDSCHHAVYSRAIARYCFGIQEEAVLRAIEQHTTGAPGMDLLSMIVFIADYIEAGRTYAGLDKIRAAAGKDLNICMEMILQNTIEYLRGRDIYYKTIEAYSYYKRLNRKENI